MKHALTIRLERSQLVALRRLAQQREVSQAFVAGEAIEAYLKGEELASLGRLTDELREGIAAQSETHRAAMAEQQQLIDFTVKQNSKQIVTAIEGMRAAIVNALEGVAEGSGNGGPGARPSGPEPEIRMGKKLSP